jgi:Ca-activated chloride channel family protein
MLLPAWLTVSAFWLAQPSPPFKSGVSQVEVYASVTSADGSPILDLRRDDFRVYEDGRLQRVDVFAAGEFPLSVALAIDRSFSMAGERLALARSAAHVFLGELRQTDRAAIVSVGGTVETEASLSVDRAAQHQAIAALEPWGTTPLHDAILDAIAAMEPAGGRRALVLLSDGDDRYSMATAEAVLTRAQQTDVLIYPVAIGSVMSSLFGQLADATGGRAFRTRRPSELSPILRTIAAELRHQYLLGYAPPASVTSGPAVWRTIDVQVERAGAMVRARRGYWSKQAPDERELEGRKQSSLERRVLLASRDEIRHGATHRTASRQRLDHQSQEPLAVEVGLERRR